MKKGVKKRRISPIVLVAVIIGAVLIIAAVFGVISIIRYNQENNFYDGSLLAISEGCKKVGVNPTSADCSNPSSCTITLKRIGTNKVEIAGVILILKNNTDNSGLIHVPGNIEPSSSKTVTVNTNLTLVNKVESNAYQIDSDGYTNICYYTGTFDF